MTKDVDELVPLMLQFPTESTVQREALARFAEKLEHFDEQENPETD